MWILIKPLVLKHKEGDSYKYLYYQFKRNPRIINPQLNATPHIKMDFNKLDAVIGNKNAELTLTCVANTNCIHCSNTHRTIVKMMEKYPEKIKLIIRFMSSQTHNDEALHLLEVFRQNGSETFEKAIQYWFKTNDYRKLKVEFPVKLISPETIELLERQDKWCKLNNVTYTPTIFMNDKKVMKEYRIDDLKYLFDNLLRQVNVL